MLNAVLSGAVAMASLLAALFFLRYWRTTGDRFFLYFAASFALEATSRLLLSLAAEGSEDAPFFYLLRLLSYGMILVAIYGKNRSRDE